MITVEIVGRTDVGKSRSRNEDAWAAEEDRGLVAVADGMGGHPAGHVASRLAIDALSEALSAGSSAEPPSVDERNGERAGEAIGAAVRSANRRILEEGERNPERKGMGTTLTALRLDPDQSRYLAGHVGDSRAYLYRDGKLEPVTRDHTPLQPEVDAGRLTREEARVHPLGHVLSQALGTSPEVEPQVVEGQIRPGDLFLLCTDGLTAVLSEDRIAELLGGSGAETLGETAERLVGETLEGGAPDNVTVALARVAREGGSDAA